jgi:hypothetical protein
MTTKKRIGYEIGIKHPSDTWKRELTNKQAVHPAKRKVQVINAKPFKMLMQ